MPTFPLPQKHTEHLTWYGAADDRLGIPNCIQCADAANRAGLSMGCALGGIEYEMLREYIDIYHKHSHIEVDL